MNRVESIKHQRKMSLTVRFSAADLEWGYFFIRWSASNFESNKSIHLFKTTNKSLILYPSVIGLHVIVSYVHHVRVNQILDTWDAFRIRVIEKVQKDKRTSLKNFLFFGGWFSKVKKLHTRSFRTSFLAVSSTAILSFLIFSQDLSGGPLKVR